MNVLDGNVVSTSVKLQSDLALNHADCLKRLETFDAKVEGQFQSADLAAAEVWL